MNLLKRFFVFAGITLLSLAVLVGCNFSAGGKNISIEMDKEVIIGLEYDLVAKLGEGNAAKIEWSVDYPEIATIENGKFVPKSEGFVTIIAKLDGQSDILKVSVREPYAWSVSYNLNGGYAEGLFESYTEISDIALPVPTRHGYNFMGWYENAEFTGEPLSAVNGTLAKDLELHACWELQVYELEYELNGGKVESSLLPSYSVEQADYVLPEVTKEHYNFLGWFAGDQKVEVLNSENLGITKLEARFEAVEYAVEYELDGGKNADNPATYTVESFFELAAPTKVGYTFDGWYLNGEKVEGINEVLGDVVLVAKWTLDVYQLSFELNGGSVEGLPTEYSIENLIASLPDAEKPHYTFLGWYDEEGKKVESITAANLGVQKLTARFEIVSYKVTYDLDGGVNAESNKDSYTVESQFELAEPTKEGFKFLGWYAGDEKVETLVGKTEDITLVAKWEEILFDVSYELNGGYFSGLDFEKFCEEFVALFNRDGGSDTVTTKENFKATSHPQIKNVFAKAENLEAYKWLFEIAISELKLAAELNAVADLTYLNQTVEMLEKMAAGDTTAVGGSYADGRTIFRFWVEGLMNVKLVATGTSYYQNLMTDYSKEENFGRVMNAASNIPSQLKPGQALPTPEREGFIFLGWFVDGVKVEEVTADCTVVAEWKEILYEVEFDADGGELDLPGAPISIEEFGDLLVALFNKDGKDSVVTTKENFKATSHPHIKNVFSIAENLTAYKWLFELAIQELELAAELNAVENRTYLDSTIEMLTKMAAGDTNAVNGSYADGRTIFRWWLQGLMNEGIAATGTSYYQNLMIDYSVAENKARFEAVAPKVSSNKVSLAPSAQLPVPTKDGYEFVGWFLNGEKVESVSADCVLVAKWTEIKYEVELDPNDGVLSGFGMDTFVEELIALFNKDGGDALVTTKENFKATSHPHIKNVFAKAENLAAYKWFFEFAISELKLGAELNNVSDTTYLDSTIEMLEKMAAGDTTAVGGSYADGRTIFRWWVEGLINCKNVQTGASHYQNLMVDYSNPENLARFLVLLGNPKVQLAKNDKLPTPTREGYNFLGWYEGDNLVTSVSANCTLVAKWEVIKFEISYDLNGGAWEDAEGVTEFEYNQVVELLVPVKEGYVFLGWTQNSVYVEEIVNDNYTLVAKWKAADQTGFEVIFDLNGGSWGQNLETFIEDLLADFNTYGESSTVTTKENFKATSHPQIKTVWNNAERLAKYQWLFKLAIAELTRAAELNAVADLTYLNSTVEMLEKMAAGDTAAVGGSYADGRTIFRFWIEGLINGKLVETGTSYYQNLMIDYSKAENMAKFVAAYCPIEVTVEPNEELPVPVRENYVFAGWYVNGEKVEFATGDYVLVAHWTHVDDIEWTVDFELEGGAWEGQGVTEFGDDLVALFNKDGQGSVTTTKESFKDTSHPQIKNVFSIAENLTAYKWLFEFAIQELELAAELNAVENRSYLDSTIEMLTKMAAGDTNAVNGSYADGRTIFRWWLQGLMNEGVAETGTSYYQNLMIDYSVAENMARFLDVYAVVDDTYTAKDQLPTPVKEGHLFLGWAHEGEIVTAVRGNWTLVAQWLDLANTEYSVSYDLAEGAWGDEQGAESFKYNQFAALVTPVREGYKFVGWFENDVLVSAINENRDYVLVAKWESESEEPEPEGNTLYVDANNAEAYQSLEAAIDAAQDGDTIVVAAGQYTLSCVINKSVTIVGPNADLPYSDFSDNKAVIVVTEDVAGNLNAAKITFNGVTLEGARGGGAGIPGVYFQDGGNLEEISFISCEVTGMNTFVKFLGGSSSCELLVEDCYFHMIGQFILWVASSSTHTSFISSYVDGDSCGKVTSAMAALLRIRYGYLTAYNNYFKGDQGNTPGYFECSAGASEIKYNTFDGVYFYLYEKASHNVVFDQNLYIDLAGNVLTAVPAEVTGTGVTPDATVCTSEAERANAYIKELIASDPERYFEISFDANGGELTSSAPAAYDKEAGIATLPSVEREGYIFVGWFLDDKLVESIPAGTCGNIALVAKWREPALIVDGTDEEGHYKTLADALAAVKEGETIKLVAGEYTESVTINVANIKIVGPNAGISAVDGTRVDEAIFKGVITVTSSAQGLVIDGLSFTGDAKIKYDESKAYDGFVFQNNKVYDTTETTKAWDESRYALPAFIQFTMASGGTVSNTEIRNNSFVNVSEINVLVNRAINLTVNGNEFKDFDLDAIRIEGGYAYGVYGFTNNVFEQTVAESGNNGIFFRSIAGASSSQPTHVIIKNNSFIKLGKNNGSVFTGAIGSYAFQENITKFEIVGNIFDHCYDYLYLRNNGGNSTTWECTVENNQFLGLPTNQYYGSYRNADSQSTNPHLAVFTQNYYEDNDGNVISDLSAYADYFKHMAAYGTALTAKPGQEVADPVEFWDIIYDLNGGETNGTFVNAYTSLNSDVIALPVLTKVNHQFNGWLLDGELVTEIPASARGDLYLVADFSVLEGEVYNIEFVTNKETVIWPSRPAVDRQEIIDELLNDLYEWAVDNGEAKSFADYKTYILAEIAAYKDINLRNTELGNYPAEDGSTEYFFNIPKYYQKWNEFFALFNEAMLKVNSAQVFYTDTYATMVRLHQFITWSSTGEGYFASYLPKFYAAAKVPMEIPTSYRGGQIVVLPELSMKNGLQFLGWYDNPDFTGDPITSILSTDTGDKVFYAKWEPEVFADSVEINKIDELLLFTTHQLVWSILPENTTDTTVEFFSSNEAVATVNANGLITALASGTTTITMRVYSNRALDVVFDVEVYCDDYIEASYETNSYVNVNESIKLNANVVYKDGTNSGVVWSALNPEIATIDENGNVTGVAAGLARFVATAANNPELKLEFVVTVLEGEQSEMMQFILDNHESNIFTRYNLGIGAGVPDYYMDIFGSVSKLLFNNPLEIDATRENKEVEGATGDYFESMTSIEFITVHYTGNMSSGADAEANANYFVGDNAVSIHYTTGNDGVYKCLTHDKGAWHAGDSGALDVAGLFKWMPTGVLVGENDPQYPVFTISDDFYYEINGQKTKVEMARPWDYSGRGTDHILNADGTISSQSDFGQTGFANRTAESFINDQGLPFKVVDGEYYMGTTWWCYTQVYEGRICSTGGNRNSLGIESCVDKGSDLWYTWQKTAQLVAELMDETGLDITRVRGHHFYSAKDCPQPMLENDLEIWWEFLALVEAEYALLTEYADYEIEFVSNNPEIVDNTGRIIKQPAQTTCVTYTVTITKDGVSESITLASIIQGMYVNR